MDHEEITTLREAEDFISEIHKGQAIGMAHIATTLAKIRRDRLFIEVAPSWKAYIKQDRNGLGYRNSIHLSKVGEIFITFRESLEENGIKLSENLTKMEHFDEEIASRDPVYYDKFKSLSVRALKKYNDDYRNGRIIDYPGLRGEGGLTVNGAYLFAGEKKVKGINLNECRREAEAGKMAVVVWVDNYAEARRVKRRLGK